MPALVPERSALIIGATGLTGNLLTGLLLDDARYDKVYAYVRREMDLRHPKLEQRIIDWDTLDSAVPAQDVFCCLGTTIRKAGSQGAFRRVDLEYPSKVATLQRAAGSRHFLLISAIGAKARSRIFYSRTKGEVEAAIGALQYPCYSIFQPSLILGDRKERRWAEKMSMFLLPLIAPLFLGSWRKYRPIPARVLAQSMQSAAHTDCEGMQIYRYDEMMGK